MSIFEKSPDPGWVFLLTSVLRNSFAFILAMRLCHLAEEIAKGEVKETSSFGLLPVVGIVALLSYALITGKAPPASGDGNSQK